LNLTLGVLSKFAARIYTFISHRSAKHSRLFKHIIRVKKSCYILVPIKVIRKEGTHVHYVTFIELCYFGKTTVKYQNYIK